VPLHAKLAESARNEVPAHSVFNYSPSKAWSSGLSLGSSIYFVKNENEPLMRPLMILDLVDMSKVCKVSEVSTTCGTIIGIVCCAACIHCSQPVKVGS
jgi:hypothetical protein